MVDLLHHEALGPEAPARHAVVLHGIMGSGRNFRGFVRKLAERCPDTRFVLVDLRHHGDSPRLPGPNTLEAVTEDVLRLTAALGIDRYALIGHSFGGKVAMMLAERRPESTTRLFVLDSNPGFQHVDVEDASDHQVLTVLDYLDRHPGPFQDRNDAARALIEDGLSERIARWIVLNLEGEKGRFTWRLEPNTVREMLRSYFETNLWPLIEAKTPFPKHFVIGEESDRHSTGNVERLRACERAGTVELLVLAKAGHWLHVDNPEGLLELLAPRLAPTQGGGLSG